MSPPIRFRDLRWRWSELKKEVKEAVDIRDRCLKTLNFFEFIFAEGDEALARDPVCRQKIQEQWRVFLRIYKKYIIDAAPRVHAANTAFLECIERLPQREDYQL